MLPTADFSCEMYLVSVELEPPLGAGALSVKPPASPPKTTPPRSLLPLGFGPLPPLQLIQPLSLMQPLPHSACPPVSRL